MKKRVINIVGAVSLGVALTCLASVGHAADGVILIDQARARNGLITPGDAPGFPVEINRPGSYRLAGNLTIENPNRTAIKINTANVTLDLNGFTIQGATECLFGEDGLLHCTNTGEGDGIVISPIAQQTYGTGEVIVTNGIIQGMGRDGIAIHYISGGVVRNVVSNRNGRAGISGHSILIDGVRANFNGQVGIDISWGTLRNSFAQGNGQDGIFAFHALLIGNQATGNQRYGLRGQGNVSMAHNMFDNNAQNIAPGFTTVQIGNNSCDAGLCP